MNEPWWQVQAEVPADLAEAVAWLLADRLGIAVEVQDAGTLIQGANPDHARVVIGLEAAPDEALQGAFDEVLGALGLVDVAVQTRRRDDQDWRDGWKAFFKPLRLSARFGVRPPWEPALADVAHSIIIDPGMAFGTGQHVTTRVALAALDAILADRAPTTVLDVGTGTGILAIAAALLGHHAVGVDNDAVALENAAVNVAVNGVADRVRLVVAETPALGVFPVVVANIIAPVLIELAPAIAASTGEDLVLSGLLEAQEAAVQAAYPGFERRDRWQDGEWVVLHLRRVA